MTTFKLRDTREGNQNLQHPIPIKAFKRTTNQSFLFINNRSNNYVWKVSLGNSAALQSFLAAFSLLILSNKKVLMNEL